MKIDDLAQPVGIISSLSIAIANIFLLIGLLILKLLLRKNIPDFKLNIILLVLQFPLVIGVCLFCSVIRSGYS